ncbi:unnamed protein product [Peronospora belbahrii]|uniref:Phytanoyl-CoA dioxygenase n=1 Tax=Peronospora belbahrii TaxID=622444 RepID=A0AAU9LBZ2_9STRA|nr:unnamed protein product [Peronospora belbahrii]CAH0519644.1 unnamed protein product [Peronospora belbahrii]
MNSIESLAQRIHSDGFVVLSNERYQVAKSLVTLVRTQVLTLYEEYLTKANTQQLDLKRRDHAERLPGFYVREGGRIDMQLQSFSFQTHVVETINSVDRYLLNNMLATWESILTELFAPNSFQLEYIGCVLSRPGDGDQNWHLDGVHRNQSVQEPVNRLNVFVPLVAITDQTGGTEMKIRSHLHDHGARGTAFEDYKDLPSVTACVEAGTPIIMDYRVWHRGLANTSENTVRPLLYFKYSRMTASLVIKTPATCTKKRKRIIPMVV